MSRKEKGNKFEVVADEPDATDQAERDAEWAHICGLASEVDRQAALSAFHTKYPTGKG